MHRNSAALIAAAVAAATQAASESATEPEIAAAATTPHTPLTDGASSQT